MAMMYAQATGQQRIEIIPIAKDEFKTKGIDALLTFNRGEEGTIESLTLHQNGEHKAKKIE